MKNLIIFLSFIGLSLGTVAQNDTTRYTMVNGYGFTYNRLKAKAALVMPTDTVQNKLPGSIVVLNDTLYVRRATRWEPVSGGGAGIPSGGTTGQILAKDSDTSFDVSWIDNYTTDVRETVKAATSINKGQAVYVSGADGTNVIVSKASNSSEMTSSKTLGLLFQDLAMNGAGFVIISGRLDGLNTSGATAGDPVWLGTNGNLLYGIANKPVAPANLVYLGVVTRVNANNGEIFVHVQNGFEIDELHDVLITDSINNQILAYDSTTRLWKNKTIVQALGYTPVKTTDTSSMLTPYLRKADTATLSNRINQKVNISDTASMLSPYYRTATANAALATKVNISDTSTMLTPYVRAAGYGLTKSGQTLSVDTLNIATRAWRQKGLDSLAALEVSGSGTTNYVSKFTASGTVGNSQIFDNGTNVGIGTATPTNSKLVVSGSSASTVGAIMSTDVAGTTSFLRMLGDVGSQNLINWQSGTALRFATSNQDYGTFAERMRITSGGNVGINDNNPTDMLVVNGRMRVNGTNPIAFGNNAGGYAQIGVTGATTGNMAFSTFDGASILERMRIWANGRIGINTQTDAGYHFDVNGSGRFQVLTSSTNFVDAAHYFYNGGGTNDIYFSTRGNGAGSGNASLINTVSGARLSFHTNGGPIRFGNTSQTAATANYLSIESNGNIGIGNTSPSQKLDVSGIIRANAGTIYAQASGTESSGYQLNAVTMGYDAANTIGWITAGGAASRTNLVLQQSGGNVGINTPSPSEALDVNGRIRARTIDSTASAMNVLYADATGVIKKASATAFPGGSGTLNYIPKWTAANTLGNSQIFDDGTFVGIGTTSMGAKLDVLHTNISAWFRSTGNPVPVSIFNSNSSVASIGFKGSTSTNEYNVRVGADGDNMIAYTNNTERMRIFTNGRVFVGASPTDAGYQFDVNGTMRTANGANFATTSGNVGIGTTNPNAKLDVNGSGIFRDITYIGRESASNDANVITLRQTAGTDATLGALYFNTELRPSATGPNRRVDIYAGDNVGYRNINFPYGNIGIGTTSPSVRLDVTSGHVKISDGFSYMWGAASTSINGSSASNFIDLYTNSTVKARLNSAGNFGIGTTNPVQKFVVSNAGAEGLEIIPDGIANTNIIQSYNRGTSAYNSLVTRASSYNVQIGTTSAMQIDASGNVGIGAAPLNRLHVEFTNATAYTPSNTLTAPPIAYFYNNSSADAAVASTIRLDAGNLTGNNATSISAVRTGNADAALTFGTRSAGSTVTERMRIFGNGRVGINTTTDAGYQLDVNGNTRVSGTMSVTANDIFGLNVQRNSNAAVASQIFNSDGWIISGAESTTGGTIFTGSTPFAAVLGSGYNRPLQLATNNTVRMEIDSVGLVGINTVTPTERLDVNGRARIRTVDSTATATNMLYVDNNGVVKKTAVPGTSVAYSTSNASIASGSGFTFVKDSATGTNHHFLNKIEDVNTGDATVTMQIAVYKTTSTFTTGGWVSIATIPVGYAPQTTVIYELPGYASGVTYYTSASAQFSGAAEYTGTKVVRIDPSGNVDVRIGTVSASATQGGTNYVIIPIAVTWVLNPTPL